MQILNSNGVKTDPWVTPFLSLRSLLCCPSLVLSTKLRFEISGSSQRSFKVILGATQYSRLRSDQLGQR